MKILPTSLLLLLIQSMKQHKEKLFDLTGLESAFVTLTILLFMLVIIRLSLDIVFYMYCCDIDNMKEIIFYSDNLHIKLLLRRLF